MAKRTKDFRIHQEQKSKTKAEHILKSENLWNIEDERWYAKVGQRSHSPKWCSCHMCGNPRKYWNEKTIQERRDEQRN